MSFDSRYSQKMAPNTLHIFGVYSSLKMNKQKTEVMNLGSSRVTAEDLCVEHISKAVKILRIHFTSDYALFHRLNLDFMIKSLKKTPNSWRWRCHTPWPMRAIDHNAMHACKGAFPKGIARNSKWQSRE